MKRLKRNLRNGLLTIGLLAMVACGSDDVEEVTYSAETEASELKSLIENLTTEGYDVDTTAVGVYYVMTAEGDGEYVQPGDSIGIAYTGYYTNGYIFDSTESMDDGIWRYVPANTSLIEGFSDAINHLREGGKGTFIIPSSLAYGSTGYYSIPPYTTLVFDIELVAIYPDESTL